MDTRAVQYCVHPHCRYFNASASNVRHHFLPYRPKKVLMDTAGAPGSTQRITALVDFDEHREQDRHCGSQVFYNDHADMQAGNPKTCVLHWDDVISELHNVVKDKYPKRIVEFLHSESSDLNRIQEKMKDEPACTRFLRKNDIVCLEKRRFMNLPVSVEGVTATGVSN